MDSVRLLARRYDDLTEEQVREIDVYCRDQEMNFLSAAFELGLLSEDAVS